MWERRFLTLVVGVAAFLSLTATVHAQGKLPLVGYVGPGTPQTNIGTRAFLQGMQELGYEEGRNVAYDLRGWGNDSGAVPSIMADLVKEHVAVIVAAGSNYTAHMAQAATRTIPIVFGSADDPVGDELVKSLAHPGGNATGMAFMLTDVAGKRAQFIHELLPNARRVAVLRIPEGATKQSLAGIERTAESLGISLRPYTVARVEDIGPAFAELAKWSPDAVLVMEGPLLIFNRKTLIAEADKLHIPLFCPLRQMTEDGCLLSYAADLSDSYRRAAVYVDKILKGAKPEDLPVEQPTNFDLVINEKVAKTLGINVPFSIELRANKVVE